MYLGYCSSPTSIAPGLKDHIKTSKSMKEDGEKMVFIFELAPVHLGALIFSVHRLLFSFFTFLEPAVYS